MAPPSFSDVGKSSRDVFGKGYHFGVVKLDVKTKTSSGVEFNSAGSSNIDSGKVSGSLQTKFKIPCQGLTFTEKWTTDNALNTTVDFQDKLVPGLKLTLDTNFQPNTGDKSGKLKAEYKHNLMVINTDVNLASNPLVNASASVGHGNLVAGYQTAFDTGKSALLKHNFVVGLNCSEFGVHATMNDKKNFGAGIYQKVNPDLETGVSMSSAGGATSYGIGCKYNLDKEASVRAKVDNKSQIGLSYQQRLRQGITLTVSANIDGTKVNEPGHKLGLALEMEA